MPKMTMEQGQLSEEELEQKREEQGRELTKWEKSEKSEKRREQRLQKTLRESTDILHHPEEGYQCISAAHEKHEEVPADVLLRTGGVFGEKFPHILPLCKYCAKLVKMTPYREEEEKKAQTKTDLKKLAELANRLDQKGLYKEAALIDQILIEVR